MRPGGKTGIFAAQFIFNAANFKNENRKGNGTKADEPKGTWPPPPEKKLARSKTPVAGLRGGGIGALLLFTQFSGGSFQPNRCYEKRFRQERGIPLGMPLSEEMPLILNNTIKKFETALEKADNAREKLLAFSFRKKIRMPGFLSSPGVEGRGVPLLLFQGFLCVGKSLYGTQG